MRETSFDVHWKLLQERFLVDVSAGDEVAARRQVVRLHHNGVPVREIIDRIIVPTAETIGDAWADGRFSVADEHRASEIITRLLGQLTTRPTGHPRGTAVVGTVDDEHHTLPTTMAALALREDRWIVEHLGSGVPARQLAWFATEHAADLVVLSVTMSENAEATEKLAAELAASGTPVLVGAPGRTLGELCSLAAAVAAD